ncbi:hypothetical protein G5714_024582 [Onychostoma macrolepis]|uniref:Uncharacterized protein n=1 Tax=Onychostoma macrolepis TaxID=369639 RepID=A0A7J6BJ10_9TELE|nr:hypothetical protein G5714_024582 [Onychostoma macrolepis]
MSRWRGGQYIDAPHSRNLRFSLTMKAKLQGLFGDARPRDTSPWRGPETRLAGGVGTTPAPLGPVLVTVTAKLRGFSATPGPETRLAGGVGTTPAPLTLFVGNSES